MLNTTIVRLLVYLNARSRVTGRYAEDKIIALKNALSSANSRVSKLDVLEANVVARGKELKECREETMALKEETSTLTTALSSAISRLSKFDSLDADVVARTKELEECQEKGRSSEEDLLSERGRTQHLVRGVRVKIMLYGCTC